MTTKTITPNPYSEPQADVGGGAYFSIKELRAMAERVWQLGYNARIEDELEAKRE